MKRKITELENKLIEDGWCLTIKRYTGKHSEKTHRYEYHKTSDIRNNGKCYEQIIELDQKRSQIVNYGIANIQINYLDREELDLIRFLFLELRHYVERLLNPLPPEELSKEDLEKLKKDEQTNEWLKKDSVNVPNSELDERQDLPPMTPEQFDELCQEMEKNNEK